MARPAELVALRIEDPSLNPATGDGVALILNTKAGREESHYLSREAVTHVDGARAYASASCGSSPRSSVKTASILRISR